MIECIGRSFPTDLRLAVSGPEKVCIIGSNGVGKTTFLRMAAMELLARKDIRAAYMPQNYEGRLNLSATPVEFLCHVGDKEEVSTKIYRLGTNGLQPVER